MIEQFKINEQLFVSAECVYLLVVDTDSEEKGMLQTVSDDHISLNQLALLKNDHEISNRDDLPGVLRSHRMVRHLSGVAILKEFFDGIPLDEYISQQAFDLGDQLQIAINLLSIVSGLHDKNLIHKDLHPRNFLINKDSKELRLVKLVKTSNVAVEKIIAERSDEISGVLHYISPEQTGRMNRSVDYRSDIYSLGIMLYELFTKRLPFTSDNALQLVHSHIARVPGPLSDFHSEIPQVISDIVLKMIAKNAEDRYQTISGILHDLNYCLQLWLDSNSIDHFNIAGRDQASVFSLSEKLYGRGDEKERLIQIFEESRKGQMKLALVTGYSGVGKTRLINEIYKPLARENGNFISGKFNQYSQNRPYAAFEQALQTRVRQIMTLGDEDFAWWKDRIQTAIGENGRIMIEIVPDLELIIGEQNETLRLGFNESQTRFRSIFENFIGALTSEEQPLVLFIDDLQWADSGSIDMIYQLVAGKKLKNLMIVGAFRDTEVSISHPLRVMLNRLEDKVGPIDNLHLEELKPDEVNELIADSLRLEKKTTWNLTEQIIQKTGGNPFFLSQFILNLVSKELIYFDEEMGRWNWKSQPIHEMRVTENVVDLLVSELQDLNPTTQKVLSLASIIGSEFDFDTLSTIATVEKNDVSNAVWEAISEGLIQTVTSPSRYVVDDLWNELGIEPEESANPVFRFQHDKIQQAAYTLMSDDERKPLHLRIGRMLKVASGKVGQERVFNIANHLNEGSELIEDLQELIDLSRLNLQAGNMAKHSNAYGPSLNYLRKAMDLIDSSDDPGLYREILISRSESEYLLGNYDESERMYDIALNNATTDIEKAEVFAEKMTLYENTSRNDLAIKSAIKGLRILGMKLPEKPGTFNIMLSLLKAKWMLRGKSTEELGNRPNIDSPRLILMMKLLINLWGPAYLNNPNLLVLAILRLVILTVRHGNAPESALAFAFYGYITCAQLKDFNAGYEFAKFGLALNSRFDDKELRAKVYVIYAGCVAHWKERHIDTMKWLHKAYEVGKEENDLVYAGYATNFLGKNHFYFGEPLYNVILHNKSYIHFDRQIQSKVSLMHLLGVAHLAYRMTGLMAEPDVFGEYTDREALMKYVEKIGEEEGLLLPVVSFHIYEAIGDFYFGEYESALDHILQSSDNLVALLGLIEEVYHNFIHSASLLCLAVSNPEKWRYKALKRSAKNQRTFKKWANSAPDNFMPMFEAVEALRMELKGKFDKVTDHYSNALKVAMENDLTQLIALIYELEAGFHERQGHHELRNVKLRSAISYYRQWGSAAKVEQIKDKWSGNVVLPLRAEEDAHVGSDLIRTSSSSLDLETIFKASTIISGEVELQNLLEKLLQVVLENAGGQRGAVALVADGKIQVAAQYSQHDGGVSMLDEIPLAEFEHLPRSVLQFSYHTGESLILEDAGSDPRFSQDPYFQSNDPRSVLCQPVLQSGKPIAIIYLENQITGGAFTPDRLEVLKLLSGQIAVSLQNAELYRAQQDLNKAYQRFVPLDFIHALGKQSILQVKRGDSIAEDMTVMFCDIRAYTALSEGLTPKDNFDLINDYLQRVGPVITKNNGFINHYLGDGFIALFKNSAEDAIHAAFEMFDTMKSYNQQRNATNLSPVLFGIGLHKGPVMMGIIGDEERHDANVLSDAVNVSSRLEGLTRTFGVNIITSKSTLESIVDDSFFSVRNLGQYKLKGKESSLGLVEIFDDAMPGEKIKAETLSVYNEALKNYTDGNYLEAEKKFLIIKEENGKDGVVEYFLDHISRMKQQTDSDKSNIDKDLFQI